MPTAVTIADTRSIDRARVEQVMEIIFGIGRNRPPVVSHTSVHGCTAGRLRRVWGRRDGRAVETDLATARGVADDREPAHPEDGGVELQANRRSDASGCP